MSNKTKRLITDISLKVLAVLVIFMIFLPILIMLPAMFKDKYEIFSYPWKLFPQKPTFDNFSRLLYLEYLTIEINFFKSLFMTILVAALAVVFSLALNMVAAYAFARLRFPLKKFIWLAVLFTMFIPGITILITSIRVVHELGMTNTIFVLIIPGLVSAYNLFFFRQFFLGFPVELDEAAKIDGASTFQIFTRIYLPMSKTPMIIIGASIFMGYYNSYIWPTLTIDQQHKDLYQIMSVITSLYNDSSIGYGATLAAAFIAMIPPLIIFIIVQRHIRDGIQLTGMK